MPVRTKRCPSRSIASGNQSMRGGADQDEQPGRRDIGPLDAGVVAEGETLAVVASTIDDFGPRAHVDAVMSADLADEVVRHRPFGVRSTYCQRHARRVSGEMQRGLPRQVPGADDVDVEALQGLRLTGRRAIDTPAPTSASSDATPSLRYAAKPTPTCNTRSQTTRRSGVTDRRSA